MHNYTLWQIILFFMTYSVLGWICETVYCSRSGSWVNRGFLHGPYCPIYGAGALGVLWITLPFVHRPAVVLLISLIIPTALEYVTGWLLETLFGMRWWDYSDEKFQLKGRVCLKNSLLFCILGTGASYMIHPFLERNIMRIQPQVQFVATIIILGIFTLDLVLTLNSLLKLKDCLGRLQRFMEEQKDRKGFQEWFDRRDLEGSLDKLKIRLSKELKSGKWLKKQFVLLEQIVERKKHSTRFLQAFPGLRVKGMDGALETLKADWNQRKEQFSSGIMERIKRFFNP